MLVGGLVLVLVFTTINLGAVTSGPMRIVVATKRSGASKQAPGRSLPTCVGTLTASALACTRNTCHCYRVTRGSKGKRFVPF